MLARVALLLAAALFAGTGIGVHVDGFDLGFWLMALAGFFGSWGILPLSRPLPRPRRKERDHGPAPEE